MGSRVSSMSGLTDFSLTDLLPDWPVSLYFGTGFRLPSLPNCHHGMSLSPPLPLYINAGSEGCHTLPLPRRE